MHPILFQIGPITIYSYGVMLAIAVVVCALLLKNDAAKYSIKAETIYDFVFWVIFLSFQCQKRMIRSRFDFSTPSFQSIDWFIAIKNLMKHG